MRIGLGIDTHQLIPGKSIRLGGVDIPSNVSIKAHSDGDIIYHSIADSILGAIGAGDIGDHFPDTDPKNKDLDSEVIVRLAIEKSLSMNLILNNLDITLLLESPKISDYKNEIKENLVKIFMEATKDHYTDNMFNIKASTSESLGFIGKGEGVTCYCIASLKYL
ncbi:2-C-methyl-D-erythritol 2,4-cyclodiphosphate synthase [Gammaproteobacteria bacterium]|nr:2-C-methyl-D-erythritol 2,4-cyclodiphosphate synthase [Gammaproteobacteria bacterium]